MTLAANLALAALSDLIDHDATLWHWEDHQELSRAGGQMLAADLAPGSWRVEGVTVPLNHANARKLEALFRSRRGGLLTFLLADRTAWYPAADPDGSIWTGVGPTALVGTITDRMTCAFTGFPANYVVTAGDRLQILYSSSKYYLGEFAETKTASAGGAITATSLSVPLPDAITAGAAVTMIKSAAKFRLVPGSLRPDLVGLNFKTLSFTAQQTSDA